MESGSGLRALHVLKPRHRMEPVIMKLDKVAERIDERSEKTVENGCMAGRAAGQWTPSSDPIIHPFVVHSSFLCSHMIFKCPDSREIKPINIREL